MWEHATTAYAVRHCVGSQFSWQSKTLYQGAGLTDMKTCHVVVKVYVLVEDNVCSAWRRTEGIDLSLKRRRDARGKGGEVKTLYVLFGVCEDAK